METRIRPADELPPSIALETSLVEWKHLGLEHLPVHKAPLGNFLSGMETARSPRPPAARANLGNFLSGMETQKRLGPLHEIDPLETSLVEWKQRSLLDNILGDTVLGNFLSGMETYIGKSRQGSRKCLGNFLSGMETGDRHRRGCCRNPLGNFLSGMETVFKDAKGRYASSPWKLP